MALTPRSRFKYQQALAQQMGQDAASTAPVQHWTQGLARMLQGGLSGYLMNKGMQGEAELDEARRRTMAQALGAGSPDAAIGILAQNPETADMGAQLGLERMFAPAPDPIKLGPGDVVLGPDMQPLYSAPFKPATPVPGRDVPYSPEVAAQLAQIQGQNAPLVTVADPATGNPVLMPRPQAAGMSPPVVPPKPPSATELRALYEAEDRMPALEGTIKTLNQALELNDKALSGFGASTMGAVGSRLPDWMVPGDKEAALATRDLERILDMEALKSMSDTLVGATTNFELAEFQRILSDVSTPPELRRRTIQRMLDLATGVRNTLSGRIEELRAGAAGRGVAAPETAPTGTRPTDIAPEVWDVMTPEEKALFE